MGKHADDSHKSSELNEQTILTTINYQESPEDDDPKGLEVYSCFVYVCSMPYVNYIKKWYKY